MVFELRGKVALITGGASGLGLEYAKELLRNGVKGVALADINRDFGQKASVEIEKEYGVNKAIFVETDVTDRQQFENAFKKTVEQFQNIDILVNNAGILNDHTWERELEINVKGVIHGMLLGLDNYLPKHKQGSEAVVVNISSTCGVQGYPHNPIYCGTKFAIAGLSQSWGTDYHYEKTKVRVVCIGPGVTDTPLISEAFGKTLGGRYEEYLQAHISEWASQKCDHVAKELIKVIKAAPNGTMWMIEGGEPAYEYSLPERENIEKKYLNV